MKKVTTKITTKTPSSTSTSQSVLTTKLPNPRGQASSIQQFGGRKKNPLEHKKTVHTTTSKTSASSISAGGQRKTRTEETVTTRIQMPIAQAATGWGSNLRSSGIAAPRSLTFAQQQQRKQQMLAQQQAEADQRVQSSIPKMQIPRAVPKQIAGLAQQQYAQLMTPPTPAPQLTRLQAPQYGQMGPPRMQPQGSSKTRIQSRMQQPQAGGSRAGMQSRMQQPQAGMQSRMQQPQAGGSRAGMQSRMQQPQAGMQSKMQQPGAGMAPPARVIAQTVSQAAAPRKAQVMSPQTREFEMMEQFSPGTMAEFERFERAPRRRLQEQQRPHTMQQTGFMRSAMPRDVVSAIPTQVLSAAAQQYGVLMDESPPHLRSPGKGPCGPITCGAGSPQTPSPRRMQQSSYTPPPRQPISAVELQYASLMDSPEQRFSPRQSPYASPQTSSRASTSQSEHNKTADISIPTAASGQPTSLEQQVEEALFNTSLSKPGTPLRAQGEIRRMATPEDSPASGTPMVQTPEGLVPAETQLLIEAVVKRTPTDETVTRHVVAIDDGIVDERETVQLTPGKGIRRPQTPESMELIVCSSEVKMAAGYRETTTKVVFETTDDPPSSPNTPKLPASVTPHIVSQLVLEEGLDVDKTTHLHAPDLKHSSPLTYGIKKRSNALQLNKQDVQDLEQTVTWPSPRADQAQDDPQPELLATMMHTEEQGLAMGSTPDQLYSALFGTNEPVKADEGTVEVNSVATHPLHDVVVPASAASPEMHIVAMTPELANAAISAQAAVAAEGEEDRKPSDGAYSERVLGDKKEAMENVKVKNVGHRDGPPVKYPVVFDADRAAPWDVNQFDAVIKQVGAIPTSILEVSVVGPSSAGAADELRDYTADGIEYLLNMDQISHQSNVQLRGSHPPPWFPGYYMALGSAYGAEAVTIVRSPSLVLATAYKTVQPDVFNDDSIFVV